MATTEEILVEIEIENKKLKKALTKSEKLFENTFKNIKKTSSSTDIMKGVLGADALKAGLRESGEIIKSGLQKIVSETSQLEDATLDWDLLTGSAEEASKRITDVYKFANSTPFDTKEVNTAATNLYKVSQGALGAESDLIRLGDAAKKGNVPIVELSTTYGRLYSKMANGEKAFGDEINKMTDLGLVTFKTKQALQDMDASLLKTEGLKLLNADLDAAKGTMERFSNTIGGKLGTLSSTWDQIFAFDDKDTKNTIGDSIGGLTKALEDNKPQIQAILKDIFSVTGDAITKAVGAASKVSDALNPEDRFARQQKVKEDRLLSRYFKGKRTQSDIYSNATNAKSDAERKLAFQEYTLKNVVGIEADMSTTSIEDIYLLMQNTTEDKDKKTYKLLQEAVVSKNIITAAERAINKLNDTLKVTNNFIKTEDENTGKIVVPVGHTNIDDYTNITPYEGHSRTGYYDESFGINQAAVGAASGRAAEMVGYWTNAEVAETDKVERHMLAGMTTMVSSTDQGFINMNNTIENWSRKSLVNFGDVGQNISDMASGVASGYGDFTGTDLGSLIPGLGLASAGFGIISTLGSILQSGSEEDSNEIYDTSTEASSSTSSQRTNIVSSGPENLYLTNNFTINAGYIGDQVGTGEFFENEISPRIESATIGVL